MPRGTRAQSGCAVFALALIASGACTDKVPLGAWGLDTESGGRADGGSLNAGGTSSAGTQNGGAASGADVSGGENSGGASMESGGAGGDAGGYRLCGEGAQPGALNKAGAGVGVTVPYSDWSWPGPHDSMEWDIEIESETTTDGYFWNHQFQFSGTTGVSGFLGAQQRGRYQADTTSGDYETSDMVVFWMVLPSIRAEVGDTSTYSARVAKQTDGNSPPSTWWTVHMKYSWQPCHRYTLKVAKQPVTETNGDVWYAAYVTDGETLVQTFVGRILVPAAWGQLGTSSTMWSNRLTYLDNPLLRCSDALPASTHYFPPSADDGAMMPVSATPSNGLKAQDTKCASSRFTLLSSGVRHELGVPAQ